MKIILVQNHLGRHTSHAPMFPLGLSYIATALQGHEVTIFDMNLWDLSVSFEKLKKKLSDFKPDIVGLSLRNVDTTQRSDIFCYYKTLKSITELISATTPGIPIVIGGTGFSMFAKQLMEMNPLIDFGIYLEGEESFPELLENLRNPQSVKGLLYREKDVVLFTGDREPIEFEKYPIPRRDQSLIDIDPFICEAHDSIGIQSKRGCVLNCAYCSYPALSGRTMRLRKPNHVVDEIEYLISLGVHRFSFADNIFNVPVTHAREICEEIIKRKLDVEWSAWYEIRNADEELMRLAQRAGCIHFRFSPDGGTNKALDVLRKGITVEDIEESLKIAKRIHGIRVSYNFLCMLPGMTFLDFVKTLFLHAKVHIIFAGRGGGGLGWVRIYPNTEILQLAIAEGYMCEHTDMLPEDEKKLKKLFYYRRSYVMIDKLLINYIKFMNKMLKPALKAFLKRFVKA